LFDSKILFSGGLNQTYASCCITCLIAGLFFQSIIAPLIPYYIYNKNMLQ